MIFSMSIQQNHCLVLNKLRLVSCVLLGSGKSIQVHLLDAMTKLFASTRDLSLNINIVSKRTEITFQWKVVCRLKHCLGITREDIPAVLLGLAAK